MKRAVYLGSLVFIIITSCIEEIPIVTIDFNDVLVVETTLTDEFKNQKIALSRSFRFEESEPIKENNATIKVIDDDANEYNFFENESGIYLSQQAFAIEKGKKYTLSIKTQDGIEYTSSQEELPEKANIEDLIFERGFNENNEEGISIFLSSFDPSNNSKYYRFDYEETYKIIAPSWVPTDLINLGNSESPIFEFIDRPRSQQICYNTVKSNTIIQANTNDFIEDRLEKFRVHFLNRNNYIISHRYSILINMYVQNREAYTFYETLNNLSEGENILSQTQPGTLIGNVFSTNSNGQVVGYFEVASVDSKRIYFNYSDLFPDQLLPPYFTNCNALIAPNEFPTAPGGNSPLADVLVANTHRFFEMNPNPVEGAGPYDLVLRPCGDCTAIGESEIPDFWIE